jgi:hypothetical protein
MMGMRVDTTYNVHGMPWNINPKNMNLLLKRFNGSRMLGGSYTPNAKGSRSCKGTVSQPYDSS